MNENRSNIHEAPTADKRGPLLTKTNFARAALILVAGTGIALIVSYLLDDPSTANYRDLNVVCLENPDDLHGFTIPSAKLIRHLRSRTAIKCPVCGGTELARAAPCVSCGLFMPTGVHELPPDFCPHCGVAQPEPTIGSHAQLHDPGSHGDEPAIVPLLEDSEPE